MKDTEHQEQVAWIRWFRLQYPAILAFAIPNGGDRHPAVAKKLKDEGATAGVPDIFIADGKPGMFIELKAKGGRLSDSQKHRIRELVVAGYQVSVCFGWEEAKKAAVEYLTKKH